jgi:hypothetical protein
MPTDYDWVFCYSAYYPSYAGRRGDGIKWHDRKKIKNLRCIIKQQLEAFGVIYSWGLYNGGSFGDRSRLIVCMATNYYAGTGDFAREFDQLLQASSVQRITA